MSNEDLTAQLDLTGVRMRTLTTAAAGVVSADTELVFEQTGAIVFARYRGGSVVATAKKHANAFTFSWLISA